MSGLAISMSQNPHSKWINRCLMLARLGRYSVSPNPMVGACVVKSGKLIAQGHHAVYGGPHAEVNALTKAGRRARGAVLYVSLEPCSTWGKTPPCTEAVIRSGIREVVIASLDPNPRHHGRGVRLLRQAGIRVISGICAGEAACDNASFFKRMKTGMPYVTLKMAQSLDGKIAASSGLSRWITSPDSRNFVHDLRAQQDAILVGTGTWKKDNPRLSPNWIVKHKDPSKPWRLILDPRLECPRKARVFEGPQVTLQIISVKHLLRKKALGSVLPVEETVTGDLDLKDMLRKLGELGIGKLLVEGGGELAWSFIRGGLVDRIVWLVAPTFLGGRNTKTSVEGEGFKLPSEAVRIQSMTVKKLGEDFLFEGTC